MRDGGVTGARITKVTSVPTVLVNGKSYAGELEDSEAFADFVAAN